MKNPFVMMALIAASMSAAFRENTARDAGMQIPTSGGRSRRDPGPRNPAGTKIIRQFYRNKHGVKGTAKEALAWYSQLSEK